MTHRIMTCAFCHEEMNVEDRHGVAIDACPNCGGVFLDRGELDDIIDRSGGSLKPLPVHGRNRMRRRRRGEAYQDEFEWF